MRKLRLGFIGGGINSAVGNTHLIASQMDNRWEVAAGCFSKDRNTNRQTADSWNIENLYDSWEEL